jgi:hypothetical protein
MLHIRIPYKRYEGRTDDLLIAFIGYVNDPNKLQQFKVNVQKFSHELSALFNSLDSRTCSSPEIVFELFV